MKSDGCLRCLLECSHDSETAENQFDRLDIVVNNAGYQMSHEDIEEITPEELDHTFGTNVFATFLLSQAALKKRPAGGVTPNTMGF